MKAGSFERDVRLAVVGGVLFLLFLAAISLVVLRNVAGWGIRESEAAATARTQLVAERLQVAGDAALALRSDAVVASLLRVGGARSAVLYDDEGNRLGEATFLPDAGGAPARLRAESRPRDGRALVDVEPGAASPELGVSLALAGRSEERRVGKECRSRWSPYH